MNQKAYHKIIAEHYDREAATYEQRQLPNKTLQRIRDDFRNVAERYMTGRKALDFGCGAGSDACYFAAKFPDKIFTGLDLSPAMIAEAEAKRRSENVQNVHFSAGSLVNLEEAGFDCIYSFFGTLNTVHDLRAVADDFYDLLNDNGKLVVTLVNKWYPMGMLAYLRRLRFRKAFDRLGKVWQGYSEERLLPSRTYYGREVLQAFSSFDLLYRRGYSIVYPAWFQDRITRKLGAFAGKLWNWDEQLSRTPLWSWGEHILLVFEKPAVYDSSKSRTERY